MLPQILHNDPQDSTGSGAIRNGRILRNNNLKGAEEDIALLAKIAGGDASALGLLYDKYQRRIYSLALKILRNQDDATEIMQDVFLQVWEKAQLFDSDRGSFSTWLATLAHNKAINLLRSKRSKKESKEIKHDFEELAELGSDLLVDRRTALDEQIEASEREIMLSMLAQISEDQRTTLMMAYYHGYSQSEIAETLAIPLGTVKTRMRQGMIKLRELVNESSNFSVI